MKLSPTDVARWNPHNASVGTHGQVSGRSSLTSESRDWRRRIAWRLHKTMGWNYREIGDALHTTRATISQMFCEKGVTVRAGVIARVRTYKSVGHHATLKRAKPVNDAAGGTVEKRIIKPPPQSAGMAYGAPVRKFEEGTVDQMIERAFEALGKTLEIKYGANKLRPYFFDGTGHSYAEVITLVDRYRLAKGFQPIGLPKPGSRPNTWGKQDMRRK